MKMIRARSVCPHDCPSACSLDVEIKDSHTIGRVYGALENTYTAGVICEKVARYAERVHHPARLLKPLKRKGPKGSGEFIEISWENALDEVGEAFLKAEAQYGPEAIWPYYYAGTMGLVMRDGINRLRHVKRYSGFYDTICTSLAWPGYVAGTGALRGVDPREMAISDCVVIWGTNAVHTQVNVMTHAIRARNERGAKIAVVDIYETATLKQADLGLIIRPGTDAALACAIMHIAFRDGHADWDYLNRYTDDPKGLEAHLQSRTPAWASAITGLSIAEIEAFAKLLGETPKTFFRIGYGFTRQRNGAAAMHAVTSIPAVLGCWAHEGGGAFHSNSGIYKLNKKLIEGNDAISADVRMLDQCRIGGVLTGNEDDLELGPPVTALLIQNTNPAVVAPEQALVKQGLARADLFTCVHEQFMTDTAKFADIILPATTFLEHDDIYQGGGHSHLMFGPKLIEPPGQARSNHEVIQEIAKRVGAEHEGFAMSPREIIDWTLAHSRKAPLSEWQDQGFLDLQPSFEEAHFRTGFGHKDGKYHFKADWAQAGPRLGMIRTGPVEDMPIFPNHWAVNEAVSEEQPFKLTTSPARGFLNSSFTETPGSVSREGRPSLMMHEADMEALNIHDGQHIEIGNKRGRVRLVAKTGRGLKRGIVVAESIWPLSAFADGQGINTLIEAARPAPAGGGVFHDVSVWVRPLLTKD